MGGVEFESALELLVRLRWSQAVIDHAAGIAQLGDELQTLWAKRLIFDQTKDVHCGVELGQQAARLEQLARDVRYALRQVRRNPAFSGIAIATLALGIGGITAMFSAFDAVLIRPLPYADADRLVMIWDDMSGERRSGHSPAPAEWLEWRRHNTAFTDLAVTQPDNLAPGQDPQLGAAVQRLVAGA